MPLAYEPNYAALSTDHYRGHTNSAPLRGSDSTGSCPSSGCGAHYWSIERARGLTSVGVCRHCGVSREFYNVGGSKFGAAGRLE